MKTRKEFEQTRDNALATLKTRGWKDTDEPIASLAKANTPPEVSDAFWDLATHVGMRKGYGSEGIGTLYESLVEELWDGHFEELED